MDRPYSRLCTLRLESIQEIMWGARDWTWVSQMETEHFIHCTISRYFGWERAGWPYLSGFTPSLYLGLFWDIPGGPYVGGLNLVDCMQNKPDLPQCAYYLVLIIALFFFY